MQGNIVGLHVQHHELSRQVLAISPPELHNEVPSPLALRSGLIFY
jgi:hypothetical protein